MPAPQSPQQFALRPRGIGAVAADLGTRVLTLFPKVNGLIEGGISAWVILEGVAITLLIGVLGGFFPALRAARLRPTEAIRHD